MLFVRALILLSLAGIFVQDLKSRTVYWFWFPLLVVLFAWVQLLQNIPLNAIIQTWVTDMLFLLPQFLLLTLYFCLKQRRWVNITTDMLGWGDVLLLVSIGFYFPLPAFVFFYLVSLVVVILVWFTWQIISKNRDQHIPLAGMQALLLAILLFINWTVLHLDLSYDNGLSPFLSLWN